MYLRRAAWAFSRFARTAANFAVDFERPPRRPILDRYLVTSDGTDSDLQKAAFIVKPPVCASETSPRVHHLFARFPTQANVALRNVH